VCELCTKPDEKTVLIEIKNIHHKPGAKFEAGIEAMAKALGYDSERQQKEISPFKSVRDLEEISKDRVEEGLLKLWESIGETWLRLSKAAGSKVFVLNNRIFINPKTGKPLTNAAWAIIKRDILKSFNFLYAKEEERIALHAMALGKVLKGIPLGNALSYGYPTLENKVKEAMAKMKGPAWQAPIAFAKQNAGAMIVELTQKQYKAIHDTLQSGIQQKHTPGQMEESLYTRFGHMNRDWRRIAETEINTANNNGQLIEELQIKEPDEEHIFMKGVSSAEACPFCRNEVDGRIVLLLEEPPDNGGDQVTVNGQTYTAIWPGKSNYGRSRANWWVAAGVIHPHCRCTWVRYTPGFEKWEDKFRAEMNKYREASGKQRIPDRYF
jgi:hypothetical protein